MVCSWLPASRRRRRRQPQRESCYLILVAPLEPRETQARLRLERSRGAALIQGCSSSQPRRASSYSCAVRPTLLTELPATTSTPTPTGPNYMRSRPPIGQVRRVVASGCGTLDDRLVLRARAAAEMAARCARRASSPAEFRRRNPLGPSHGVDNTLEAQRRR